MRALLLVFLCAFVYCQYTVVENASRRLSAMTQQEYDRMGNLAVTLADEAECVSEEFDRENSLLSSNEAGAETCAKFSCDDPTVRDQYRTPLNQIAYIDFLLFDPAFSVSDDRLRAAVFELNKFYAQTGIQFVANVTTFRVMKGTQQVKNVYVKYYANDVCPSGATCFEKNDPITILRGTNWNSRRIFQLAVVKFVKSTLNGFAYFPGSMHGYIAMGEHVIGKGKATLAHEIGHAFGLWHTFKNNIGDTDKCDGNCREFVASNDKGDFCSDTAPIPKVHIRYNPSTRTCTLPTVTDCQNRNTFADAPIRNLMSYGDHQCRTMFTEQQIRRIRCFASKEFRNVALVKK